MYASGLIYLKGENPIYKASTPERGGGGPYLTEIDSPLFDRAWREGREMTLEYAVRYALDGKTTSEA